MKKGYTKSYKTTMFFTRTFHTHCGTGVCSKDMVSTRSYEFTRLTTTSDSRGPQCKCKCCVQNIYAKTIKGDDEKEWRGDQCLKGGNSNDKKAIGGNILKYQQLVSTKKWVKGTLPAGNVFNEHNHYSNFYRDGSRHHPFMDRIMEVEFPLGWSYYRPLWW